MELILGLADFILHFDKHLDAIIGQYGTLTYLILFLIIFCETGLVVTPFLPGDSLLFAAGAFAARGSMDVGVLFGLLWVAAVVGDNLNYWIGRYLGPAVFRSNSRFFKQSYLLSTQAYFEKYGGKTLVLARFMPIVRTFAPFVAGVGSMKYSRFLAFSIGGGLAWIGIFLVGGFFFGNLPAVKANFKLVILAVIALSVLPAVIEAARHRLRASKA